jgi:hypothetical protein
MDKVAKIAGRPYGLRIVMALHTIAVVIVGVFAFFDSRGMLAQPVGSWQYTIAQLAWVPAILSVFVFPPAVLIAAVVRGWCMETALAAVGEVLLVTVHIFAALLSCQ